MFHLDVRPTYADDARMPKSLTLLSTSETARVLGCDVRTVHRLVESGALTYSIKGPGLRGAMLFDPHAVGALGEARKAAVLAAFTPLADILAERELVAS